MPPAAKFGSPEFYNGTQSIGNFCRVLKPHILNHKKSAKFADFDIQTGCNKKRAPNKGPAGLLNNRREILSEQLEHALRQLIGLRQHGHTDLLKNVIF